MTISGRTNHGRPRIPIPASLVWVCSFTVMSAAHIHMQGHYRHRKDCPDHRLGAPPGSRSYPDDQGLMSSTPTPAKSFSFLVAKDASLARQIAAI